MTANMGELHLLLFYNSFLTENFVRERIITAVCQQRRRCAGRTDSRTLYCGIVLFQKDE